MHKYYCLSQAGFWVYKTPEQWVKENPGVMETLTTQRMWLHDTAEGSDVVHINQRFDLIYKKEGEFFPNPLEKRAAISRYQDQGSGGALY